jgi:3-hydroxybutyryl-CoA dehydrogenase
LIDISRDAADAAVATVSKFYARNAEKGRMSEADAADAAARVSGGDDLGAAADVDLVIEAVFERFDLKAELLGRLNPIVGSETLVATNTSCLTVSGLAQHIDHPGRFLGLHYFNPAAINPIVEVVEGEETDPAAIETALAYCRATAKKPLLCKDSYGFALNRFFCPYSNEAVRLFEEGLGSPAQIDRVAHDLMSVAAGPFLVMNLVGMQTMAHACENLASHGPFYAPTEKVKAMGGENGTWEIGEDAAGDDAADKVIADRLWGSAFLAVLQELDEAIATPADIDMGAGLALRFGKAPCAAMDGFGRDEVARLIGYYCDAYDVAVPKSLERVGSLVG